MFPEKGVEFYALLYIANHYVNLPYESYVVNPSRAYIILGGLLIGFVGAAILYLTIRVFTRSVKYVSLWVIEGFRDK